MKVLCRIGYFKQGIFGGTDLLLERAVEWLDNNGFECKLVDVKDFSKADVDVDVDVVIMPTSSISDLSELKLKGFKCEKIFVWCMGHGAFDAAFINCKHASAYGFFLYPLFLFINKFKLKLLKSNSLFFTDKVGLVSDLGKLSADFDDRIIPIPVKRVSSEIKVKKIVNESAVRLGWVGRVSKDFKFQPLVDLLSELASIEHIIKIKSFTVVGTGDGLSELKRFVKNLSLSYEVKFIDHIPLCKLPFFINDEFDVLFAMGTSSLDGARSFVPTVIVKPYSTHDKECGLIHEKNKYRFVFESKGFSLGELSLGEQEYQDNKGVTDIFDALHNEGFDVIALKSAGYCESFYEDVVFPKLASNIYNVQRNDVSVLYYILFYLFFSTKKKLKVILRSLGRAKNHD